MLDANFNLWSRDFKIILWYIRTFADRYAAHGRQAFNSSSYIHGFVWK